MTMEPKRVLSSAVAAGFVVAAGTVHAQQDRQEMSAQEVKSFLETAERDATQVVQAGDYARLLDWTKNNLAENATFFLSQEIYVGDERKSFVVTTLDKQDMLRLSRIAVGVMSGMSGQAVQDYSLDIEVIQIDPIGPNAATATTRITESGRLALPRGASGDDTGAQALGAAEIREASQAGSGGEVAQEPGTDAIQVEATAWCKHLIQRGEKADQLVMGMTACEAHTRF